MRVGAQWEGLFGVPDPTHHPWYRGREAFLDFLSPWQTPELQVLGGARQDEGQGGRAGRP